MAARSAPAEAGQLVEAFGGLAARAPGLRCLSSGMTSCSNTPASRSAATLYIRRCRASTPWLMNPAASWATSRASSP